MSETVLPPADVTSLAEALIACPSVTPATGMVFDCLEGMLAPLGFEIHRFIKGEAPDGPVENMFAIRRGPGAAATSPMRAIWTWCPRATAGPARPSRPSAGASCSMAGARWT
jgi:acetylornithine deacetylase/succinyl-diaminopimelate desuccinylase-like protein